MDTLTLMVLVLTSAAIILAAYVFIKTNKKGLSENDQKFIKKNWDRIIQKANGDPHHAVLEADKLIGHTLKLKGIEGSVGEQLKAAPYLFGNVDELWKAHKARNQLAHEIGKQISLKEAKIYLNIFKKALKDLGVKI
jgi:hypothetical protein